MKYSGVILLTLFAIVVADNATSNRQARFESRNFHNESKEVSKFLTGRNLFRTVVKLLFGSEEESRATSRQVLNFFDQAIDMFKNTIGARARSSDNRGIRAAVDDVALASASILKGCVKSLMATDEKCAQKFLCEASQEAIREGRELGHIVAQVGGYASSYLLQNTKSASYNHMYDAARKGRSGDDCTKLYGHCNTRN